MPKFNTGNPVGSSDPRDLYDNAETLDQAVNAEADTFQDRLGKSRLTWAGIVKAGTGDAGVIVPVVQQAVQDVVDGVDGQVAVAESAADRAEAARDAAQLSAGVYADTAAGLAATTEGDYFSVPSASSDEYLILFRHDAGLVANEVKRYPALATVVRAAARSLSNTRRINTLEQSMPLDADNAALALLGDETTGIAIDVQAKNEQSQVIAKNDAGQIVFRGSLDDLIAGQSKPKMVEDQNGGVAWANHNNFSYTDDLESWTTYGPLAIEGGQLDSQGGESAFKLTGGGRLDSSAKATPVGRWHSASIIAKSGSAGFAYISIRETTAKNAFFDLVGGTLGTVDAGVEAEISSYDASGHRLASGFYRIVVKWQAIDTPSSIEFGPTLTDGVTNAGGSVIVEKPHFHYGKRTLPYYENTTGSIKSSVAFDWSNGEKMALFQGKANVVSQYSDDLTQEAWAKTNCTATLDQIGPHSELCSRLTATSDNAVCTQAATTTASETLFSAYLRPSPGHGTIEMTTDGGATWVDITDRLDPNRFNRVHLDGGNDPIVGFRLATSGDTLDVALAFVVDRGYLFPPLPVYADPVAYAADPMTLVTSTYFGATDTATLFASLFCHDWRASLLEWKDNTGLSYIKVSEASGAININPHDESSSSRAGSIYHTENVNSVDVVLRTKPGKNTASFSGEPLYFMAGAGKIITNSVKVGDGSIYAKSTYLRNLVVVPRAIPDADTTEWKYRRPDENLLRNTSLVSYDGGVPGTSMCREPVITVLKDDGEVADLMVVHMQKHLPGYHAEAPARLMQRNYRYHKTDDRLIPLTEAAVLYEHPGWSDDEGHNQSPVSFIVPHGPYAGRVVLLFSKLDGADFGSGNRNVYVTINDQDGAPGAWTTPKIVVTAASMGVGHLILAPDGGYAVLPSLHPVAPDRVVTVMYGGSSVWSLYSDDFGGVDGTNWTVGNPDTGPAGDSINETNIAYLPDGRLITTQRLGSNPTQDRRSYSLSDDGGVTFVSQGFLPNWEGAACSASLIQLDPTGVYGAVGRLALVHPAAGRLGVRIGFATDDTFEFKDYIDPMSKRRYFGYSSVKSLFGGSHLAIGVESGTEPFNYNNSAYLAIIKVPEA